MSLQAGDRVGDYEVVSVLGRGGMGKVFRVRNLISERVEAMKVVLPDLEADPGFADRFLREIKVHASLEHPHIARLYTAFRAGDRICMILELVEGVSLDARIRQGAVDAAEAASTMDQVLSALAFAHMRGVIHRDIKPANIILGPGGLAKLTDFGIAHAAGVPRLTLTGMALGSLFYLSPEQIRGGIADARSDLYSLGVTFYEMVTGKRPIEGETEYSVMNAHVQQVPVPPEAVKADLPAAVSAVILKALEKNPADRFQTADEFRSALARAMGKTPGTRIAAMPPVTRTYTIAPDQLARLETKLLPFMGPIAKQLVARAGRRSLDMRELCRTLAEEIPKANDREAFLRSCQAELGPSESPTSAGPAPAATAGSQSWDAAVLQDAKRKLAAFIGPIAGLIVDRTSKRTRTERELYQALAAEIPMERDRARFLSSAPR